MNLGGWVKTARPGKRAAVCAMAVIAGISLTGCGAVESFNKQTADAWSVTYEVTVTGETINAVDQIVYLESPGRGEASAETTMETAATVNDAKNADTATWRETTIVTAEDDAGVAATPRKGASATCRVLLDGEKEISTKTGAVGERVECRVKTPAFAE
ncbi:hypothetical protein ACX5K5_15600 [Glutamicibacter bergerei]